MPVPLALSFTFVAVPPVDAPREAEVTGPVASSVYSLVVSFSNIDRVWVALTDRATGVVLKEAAFAFKGAVVQCWTTFAAGAPEFITRVSELTLIVTGRFVAAITHFATAIVTGVGLTCPAFIEAFEWWTCITCTGV